jgi:acetylornithine deacetylase/succinyl-diaminopimelate desuccinylase
MAEAGRLLASQRDLWRGTLVLMFVADEEIDGGGSRALAKQQPRPDLIVIGEPTNNAVYTAHKGCLRPLIRAKGKAAHSGRPELGVNAILAASHLIAIFDERDRKLRTRTHPLVGQASLSVTRIAGGIADNVVPENCELVLDRRLLPGETLDAAMDELHAMLTRAKRDHGVEAEIAAIRTKAGSTETALDDPLVRNAVAISRAHGVTFPQPGGLTGGCDLVHFHDIGAVGSSLARARSTLRTSPTNTSRRTTSPAPPSSIATSRSRRCGPDWRRLNRKASALHETQSGVELNLVS